MSAAKAEVSEVVDFRGRTIRVGDTVLYPRMSGRSCEMTEAEVLAIFQKGTRRIYERNPNYVDGGEERYYIHRTVPQYEFRVMPGRGTRNFYRWSEKAVYILLGENVVKADV